jgi:hypothetical protein
MIKVLCTTEIHLIVLKRVRWRERMSLLESIW